MRPYALLHRWLVRGLPGDAGAWFEAAVAGVAAGGDRELYLALGAAPRRVGQGPLPAGPADLAAADAVRPGWRPVGWTTGEAARVALLLAAAERAPGRFPELLDTLCATAEVGELVAFYKGLPLYPEPERLLARACEGARSNIRPVFEAVAHVNPYPAERFPETAWNHLVLKALFVDSALAPIHGLDERANRRLAHMLCDYADERRAAGRDVSPELWRCVGPFPSERTLACLERAMRWGDRPGAALALAAARTHAAAEILDRAPILAAAVGRGEVTWTGLAAGGRFTHIAANGANA